MAEQDTESDDPSDSRWWDVSVSDLRDWRLLVKVAIVVAAAGLVLWLVTDVLLGGDEGFCSGIDPDPPHPCATETDPTPA